MIDSLQLNVQRAVFQLYSRQFSNVLGLE